jgi:hypothetical protein
MHLKDDFDIVVRTIQMQQPILLANNTVLRQSLIKEEEVEKLLSHETFLRRTAYKHTTIKTDESFFDDSDMKSVYFLVVVYDRASNTPLLSSRYYFEKSLIAKFLKGENNFEIEPSKFNLDSYSDGKIFLADRLSGNINNSIYRKYRSNVFSLYYSEIATNNKNRTLVLMVRKEKRDKQLSKYLDMGFTLIGSTLHKGKEHSIILRDLS